MIETLRIENLAVVESAELEFGPGLNVLTGETGAGKSIVLGALALLAGARASQAAIREGAEEATVEALFRTEGLPDLTAELERRGLPCPDGELVVRRTLSRNGRSRARIGGELVPRATLAELFDGRLEISSQHESQQLLRPAQHGLLLDTAGGLLDARAAVAAGVEALRRLERERAALRADAEERERREDFLRFQVREIDEAKLAKGEFEILAADKQRLMHAERLCADASLAASALAGDPAQEGALGAVDRLAEASRRVEGLASLDPGLAEVGRRLAAAQVEVDDLAQELAHYARRIESDPGRLADLEDRLAVLERLRRKYGPTEEAVLAFRDRASADLERIDGADARVSELEIQRERLHEELRSGSARLSAGRARAARRLGRQVEERLRELAMPDARFAVALDAVTPTDGAPCGPGGAEAPEFRFSANPGEELRPLHRVASGGELSRVFLALKSALRRAGPGMVLVFDEVDAGIGGHAADRVGRLLAELSSHHQILCITHLPQIAACADLQFRVTKKTRRGRTLTEVAPLGAEQRVEEIARMAAGAKVGEATRRHAKELLRSHRD